MGRLSAHIATADGRDIIDKRHYIDARRNLKPTIRCSFCNDFILKPGEPPNY
jgi:hypothetical protein